MGEGLVCVRFIEAHEDWSKGAIQEMTYDMAQNLILDEKAEEITKEEYNKITGNEFGESLQKKLIQEKEQEVDNRLDLWNAEELLNSNIQETKFIIQHLLAEQGVTIVGGDSGVGKSWLALYAALCLSSGSVMFGSFKTEQTPVLYIDEENNPRTIKTRLHLLKDFFDNKSIRHNYKDITFSTQNDIKLDKGINRGEQTGLLKFKHLINTYQPKVCFIDSLVRFFMGDENSSNDIKQIYDTLKWAMREYGTSFFILHHTTKAPNGGSYFKHNLRGSGDISAQCDIVLMMQKLTQTSPFIKITQEKNRHEEPITPFNIMMQEVEGLFSITYGGASEVENATVLDEGIKILCNIIAENDWVELKTSIAKPQFTKKGENETNFYRCIKKLEKFNVISKFKEDGKIKKGKYKIEDKFKEYYENL